MKVIGVTSCPVGMAHTYMAAKALKKACRKLGYEVKVETQGSMGIKDELTVEDILSADVFIDSADGPLLEKQRFSSVLTYRTSTTKLIKNGVKEVQEAIKLIK